MNKSTPIAIIVAIVFAGAGFYGGMLYGTSKNSSKLTRPAGMGGAQNGTASSTGSIVYGEIVSVDSASMTVKASDGGSKIVFFSGSTKITKNSDAQASDLAAGSTVMASGGANSDGSVSAKTIELNPQTRVNQQNGQSNSGSTKASAATTQDDSASGGTEIPPMDDNGAGGPPPGM